MSEVKRLFTTWTVNGEDYNLKLRTKDIVVLEEKLKENLMSVVIGNGIPKLSTMLLIIHRAMQGQHANIKEEKVYDIFDKYIEEDGTQMSLFTDVILPLMSASGFFTSNQTELMEEKMEEAKEMM